MIALPLPRVRFTSKERNVFTGSGELSTHTPSFSGIPLQHIRDLPRLLAQNRKDVTGGITSPVWSVEAAAEFAARGEVLFLAESKSIDFCLNFFRDLDLSAVFDLCPGTGAAAIAALLLGIKYDCLCMTKAHKLWLDHLLNKVLAALVHGSADNDTKDSKDNKKDSKDTKNNGKGSKKALSEASLVQGVRQYFASLAEEGELYMRAYKEDEDGPRVTMRVTSEPERKE